MIRRPPRSTQSRSSAASDVYKRQALGGALKTLKALSKGHPLKMVKGLLLEFFKPIPKSAHNHIKRMNLLNPFSLKDKIMRKTVVFALRNNHELQDSAYLQTPIPNRVVDK